MIPRAESSRGKDETNETHKVLQEVNKKKKKQKMRKTFFK